MPTHNPHEGVGRTGLANDVCIGRSIRRYRSPTSNPFFRGADRMARVPTHDIGKACRLDRTQPASLGHGAERATPVLATSTAITYYRRKIAAHPHASVAKSAFTSYLAWERSRPRIKDFLCGSEFDLVTIARAINSQNCIVCFIRR